MEQPRPVSSMWKIKNALYKTLRNRGNGNVRWDDNIKTALMFSFSLQLLSETFLILKIIKRNSHKRENVVM
jgi:hypothetical protein